MVLADMDQDGRKDIVIRHLGDNKVRIIFHNGGSDWKLVSYPVRAREGLDVADLDNDKRPDIILNGFVWFANGSWRSKKYTEVVIDKVYFTQNQSQHRLNNSTKSAVADFNSDGRLDIIFSLLKGSPDNPLAWYAAPSNPRTGTGLNTF